MRRVFVLEIGSGRFLDMYVRYAATMSVECTYLLVLPEYTLFIY